MYYFILLANIVSKTASSFHVPQSNRFLTPHSSQFVSKLPFFTICPQTRPVLPITITPMFTAPFQCCPRERFQVNSIGRPILRANNYNSISSLHSFKVRR